MAINLTGAKIFTGGLYSTDVGGQTGELLFSGGIWEGGVAGAVVGGIAMFTAWIMSRKKEIDSQHIPGLV